MKIYSIFGVEIADVPVQSNAEHERELMKSNFVRLEWSQSSLLKLPCGSYIEYNGIKYRLLKDYKPEQQSTQQWDYSPEFQHPIMMLGTILFILVTGDTTSWQSADKETEWNWTGMAINLIQEAFVPFLNKYGADNPDIGTGWTAVVDSDLKASETCTFQSMDFLSALSHAAQQFECEWHLDYENKILYFGHINITTSELVFEVGNNIDKPTIRENNEGYYNAYIAKGSTRNISQVNDKGENIQLNKRLTLNPEKYPDGYIDRRKSDKEPLVVKELIYDDIYPSLDLYIYNPRARTRYLLDSNTGDKIEDKNDPTGYKRYSIWYVRLAYKMNGEWKDFEFSKDMLIGNLSCQFQGNENSTKYTSPLAGREFELTYHDSDKIIPADPVTGDTGITIKKGDYEIIYDENNGLIIPTTVEGGMYPRGDEYQSEDNNILRLYNIALPSEYTSKAQEELETQALKDIAYWESDRNNYEFNSNPIAFKKDMPKLFIGRGVVYKNGDYQLNTRISKLVQKIDFPYEVEITVGNEEIKGSTTTMREQLQMVVSAMSNGMGGMSVEQFKKMLNIYATSMFGNRFLSKLTPDTAAGIITFLQGTNWGNFTSETGASMAVDPTTGQTYMEVDRLKVRLKAFFEQLEVQKVGYVGGKIVVSKGQGVDILDVEEIYDSDGNLSAYRCYFLGEQEGRRIDNLLRVDDQMICKDDNISEGSTDGATNKYYWRLATAVSSDVVKRGNNVCHWVDLSATDCDTNSDVPEIGDTICQLGNRNDIDRQGAEILSVVDANSPSFTIYAGINSYSLVNKEYIDMGVINGKAYCNIYGSTYIGDRDRKSGYLRWNDDKKTFGIKGTIDISSPLSSGGTIGGAIDNAANAYKGEFDAFTSNVNEVIGGFQAQIDGVIETWFYEPEPTLGNEPAVNWTDNATKDKHLGDLYYSGEGLAYRFQKEGDNYVWKKIDDTAITKALEEAKKANDAANAAQGTADSKMKVFVVQPTADNEYSVGDMWVNATYPADGSQYNNDILKCKTPKSKGTAFSINHWEKASKYTDDTIANEAQKTANDAATAAQEINASITAIDGNVDVALKDKIITKTEAAAIKEALKGLDAIMADVNKTKEELVNNAVYKNIAADVKTDYDTAYTNLKAAYNELSKYINDTLLVAKTITDEILSSYTTKYSTFKTKYEDYVSKLTVVRNSMDALLNTRIGDIATMLGGLKATTDAMNESTQINGGLILSSLLALGYTKNSIFNVMSGVSGLYESGETGGGIAFWAGGHRIDINNCTKNADGTYSIGGKVVNPADFLVRHDGTGYAAGGKMWWDEDGKIHADPQSFLINEQYVGNVMQLFQFEYSGGTNFTHIVHAIPQKPFESLSVGANGLTLYNGDKSAKFYVKDGVLFIEGDLAVTGGITMYASDGVKSGMIDQVYAVLDPNLFSKSDDGTYITITGEIGGGTVKAVKVGTTQYDPDSNGIISLPDYTTATTVEWDNILNKPSSFIPSAHTHAISEITNISSASVSYASSAGNADTLDGNHASAFAVASHTHNYLSVVYSENRAWSTIECVTDPLKFKVYEVYNDGGPSTYGEVLSVTGITNHWQAQLWMGSGKGGRLYYRNKEYNDNTWGDWRTVAFTSDNVASANYASSAGNADTLDGYHYSSFAWASHSHSYLPLSGGTLTGPIEIKSSVNDNFNEGLRITRAANDWAGITFGSTGLSGAPTDGWFVATNPSNQFIISPDTSANTTGLTLNRGGDALWRNYVIIHSGNIGSQSVNYASSSGYASSAGNASTATLPYGFTSRDSDWMGNWGMPGTYITAWGNSGGSIGFKVDGDHINVATDGYFYHGIDIYGGALYRCLDTHDSGGYGLITTGNYSSYALPISGGTVTGQVDFTYTVNHAIQIGTIRGRAYGSRTGEYIHMYERVHIGSPSGWGSLDAPSYGISTYGGAWFAMEQGNVGIGTTSPSEKLHVVGNILASGGITMYSDLRKKNILSDEVLSVKEIAAAPLFAHTYKSDENHYLHIGTSAQYWSGIHEDWFTRKDGEGYYQMELQNLGVAMGISLAREIVTFEGAFKKYESKTDKKIRLMKKKINDLEAANKALDARIKELEGSREERRTA